MRAVGAPLRVKGSARSAASTIGEPTDEAGESGALRVGADGVEAGGGGFASEATAALCPCVGLSWPVLDKRALSKSIGSDADGIHRDGDGTDGDVDVGNGDEG